MKSNELRIGNLLSDRSGVIVSVSSIHLDDTIRVFENGETHGCSETNLFNPIPLTGEWFVNFGFENTEFCFRIGSVFFTKGIRRDVFLYQAHQNRFSIKYVHQLQNLYFALTGTELTVKK